MLRFPPFPQALPAGALLLALAVPAFGQTPAAGAPMPLDEVRVGMIGEGRTEISRDGMKSFQAEILGVLRNPFPGRNVVLARLSGDAVENSGVFQGMSGSPVYVDGRLLGAVAYAFPFSTEPICGITPFEEMVRYTEPPAAGPSGSAGMARLSALRFSAGSGAYFADGDRSGDGYAGSRLAPIRAPVAASGLAPSARRALEPLFEELGFELAPGGASTPLSGGIGQSPALEAGSPAPSPGLAPGSSVGAALVTGDVTLMASGTVTHVDPETGEVYAFGHPFFGLGAVSLPMTEAPVETVVASIFSSFKVASAGATIGAWRQDRAPGVRGRLGARPRMLPMTVEVENSRGGRNEFEMELAIHDALSPGLAYAALVALISQEESAAGARSARIQARIGLEGGRTVAVEDLFASGGGSVAPLAAGLVAGAMAQLLDNPLERIPVRGVEVDVGTSDEVLGATLDRAWLPSPRARAGDMVTVRTAVRDFRGDERTHDIRIRIPAGVMGRSLELLVGDAATIGRSDREQGASRLPANAEQLIRQIAQRRRSDRLYARLIGPARGAAIVGGEYLPTLPPSVRSVVARDSAAGTSRSIASSVLAESHVDVNRTVTGSRRLRIELEPS